jgi:hypothetical protein
MVIHQNPDEFQDLTIIARDNGACVDRKYRSNNKLGAFIFECNEAYARILGCTSLHAIFANPKFIHHGEHNIKNGKTLGTLAYSDCDQSLPFYVPKDLIDQKISQ